MEEDNTEPLAKTRTRRSNAGARMHEMMFAAEDNELLAQALGIIKNDDDSSDDEEYVPKDLETSKGKGVVEGDEAEGNNSEGSVSSSNSCSDSDDDDDDEEEDEDDEEEDEDGDSTNRDNLDNDGQLEDASKIIGSSSKFEIKKENPSKKVNSHIQPGSPSKAAYDSCKKICSVCLGDQSDEDDEIIECDSCGISVHESCYGVSSEPNDKEEEGEVSDHISVHSNISSESTEPWFCEPCKRSVINPHCELCPNRGGIFKQTDTGRWIHMVCALYTRGVTFEDIDHLSEVSLFELNYALYGSKTCTICEDRRLARSGICIGCDAGLCKTFFHPTCAQKEGLLFESHSDEVDPYFAQCKQHADKTTIKTKKRLFTALHARLKRTQPLQSCSERIKNKLNELTQKPDPHLSKWTPDNRPPIPLRTSRMLMTSPSLILRLSKKSELMGLNLNSAFMNVQDEMETARQKWHIPPAFNLEFVAYCIDRTTRLKNMNKQNLDLVNQNTKLKSEEANLREKYNSIKEMVSKVRLENETMIKEARALQKAITASTGKQFNLPMQMEQLIARSSSNRSKNSVKSPKNANKTSVTYSCGKCGSVKDQHLLALCDTCNSYFHIYCLDPPLTRVPKKTKFGGWQCSDCSERDEEEQEEALEEQNILTIQDADGPRRLRERIKFPDKYCHESMMMADFWSLQKKKSKKSSKGGNKSKKAKVES